jgi:hypothetical protein
MHLYPFIMLPCALVETDYGGTVLLLLDTD